MAAGKASAALVLKMYKAKPISESQAPGLMHLYDQLLARAQLPYRPELYYVPSHMMNAFATGRDEHVAIAVTDGLLRNMTLRELAGVLAHEISHIRHRDIFVMSLADAFSRVTTMIGQLGILILWIAIPSVLMGAHMSWLGVGVLLLAPTASALIQLALSRSREYEADLGAAQITGDPIGLAMALEKIEQAHTGWFQKILFPRGRKPEAAMLRTHPPTEDRIARLKAMAGVNQDTALGVTQEPIITFRPTRPIPQPRWHLRSGLWY